MKKLNILYGVSGEGFGHSSRAMYIADFLEKQGHNVLILTFGKGLILKKRFKVFKIKGITLEIIKGKLDKGKTVQKNLGRISKTLFKWGKIHRLVRRFKPDLCISDMEFFVPIISNWYKLPLISIDNQHRLTHLDINIPRKYYSDYLSAKAAINTFVSKANYFIITYFSKEKIIKSKRKNTTLVSPIIRPEVKRLKPRNGDKILVYLTRKNNALLKVISKIKNEVFVVYGYNSHKQKGNLQFKTKETFLSDLQKCRAVIGTAGFTLIAEAIYLRKPFLAIPVSGQFEQIQSALFLKSSGFGDYVDELTEKDVVYFLYNLEKYSKKIKTYKFDFNKLPQTLNKVIKNICG